MNLTYAAKDAYDLISTFQAQSGNYGNITVLKYLNQDATASKILQSKETLQKSKVDDEVVVFVAGHGLLDQNLDYYLGTHDVDFINPSAKGLKYEDLEGLLDGIPARKKVMLLDAWGYLISQYRLHLRFIEIIIRIIIICNKVRGFSWFDAKLNG